MLSRISRPLIRLASLALLGLGCLLSIRSIIRVFDFDWTRAGTGDCRVDWGAARLFLEHKSPYTEEGLRALNIAYYGFGHPPTTSFWFIPLARIGYPLMSELVAIITLVTLLAQLIVCANELRLPMKAAVVSLAFGWALGTTWMVEHAHVVQVSEWIAFLYVLAWYFLRRNREIEGGIALGLACTFKLFPALMVFFLILTRRIKAAVSACVAYLAIAIFMTAAYGLESWHLFVKQQAPMVQYWAGDSRNSSIVGVIAHLLHPLCKTPAMRATYPLGRLRELPGTSPPGMTLATVLSVALLALFWGVSRHAAKDRRRMDAPFALFAAASAFLNVWTWEHYYALLLFPLAVILSALWSRIGDAWRGFTLTTTTSPRPLFAMAAGCVGLAVAELATVGMLNLNMWQKESVYERYWALKDAHRDVPSHLHWELHWRQATNWLPWAVVIVALTLLLFFERSRSRAS